MIFVATQFLMPDDDDFRISSSTITERQSYQKHVGTGVITLGSYVSEIVKTTPRAFTVGVVVVNAKNHPQRQKS